MIKICLVGDAPISEEGGLYFTDAVWWHGPAHYMFRLLRGSGLSPRLWRHEDTCASAREAFTIATLMATDMERGGCWQYAMHNRGMDATVAKHFLGFLRNCGGFHIAVEPFHAAGVSHEDDRKVPYDAIKAAALKHGWVAPWYLAPDDTAAQQTQWLELK
jgi:hypothetical protein